MKKALLIISVLALLLSVAACGGKKGTETTSTDGTGQASSAEAQTDKSPESISNDESEGEETKSDTDRNGESYQNETAPGETNRETTEGKSEKATDKSPSTSDSAETKEASTTASADGDTTTSLPWSEGKQLPYMPIE